MSNSIQTTTRGQYDYNIEAVYNTFGKMQSRLKAFELGGQHPESLHLQKRYLRFQINAAQHGLYNQTINVRESIFDRPQRDYLNSVINDFNEFLVNMQAHENGSR